VRSCHGCSFLVEAVGDTSAALWVAWPRTMATVRAPVNRAGLTMTFSLIDILTDPGRLYVDWTSSALR